MDNEKTKGKGAANQSASAAEKNFITEIPVSDIDKAKQLAISLDEDKNEIPETTPQGNDVVAGKETPVQTQQTQSTQDKDRAATQSSDTAQKTQEQEKVKDKRGRKPLSDEEKAKRATETKEQTAERLKKEKSAQTSSSAESALNDDLNKYKSVPVANNTGNTNTATAPKGANPEHIDLSKYISGALFLIAIDIIMPSIALKIASFVDKKYIGVDKSLLKLDSSEKKELEPLADAVVKILFGFVHPAIAFAVVMGIMYLGKFMLLTDDDFEDAADKQRRKAAEKAKARGGRK